MLSVEQAEWNERQKRVVEFHDTQGRVWRDIERELRAMNSKLAAWLKHLGASEHRWERGV